MEDKKLLYEKIKEIQKRKKLTISKISEKTGLSKQTVSYRILNIKKNGNINLEFIRILENLSGEKILMY